MLPYLLRAEGDAVALLQPPLDARHVEMLVQSCNTTHTDHD